MSDVNFRHITNTILRKNFTRIGLDHRKNNPNKYTFCYKNDIGHLFLIDKISGEKSIRFFLYKYGSNFPLYLCSIKYLGLVKGDEKIKRILLYPFDDFHYSNEEELICLYDMVFGLLKHYADDFYLGKLDEEIFNYCIENKNIISEKYKDLSKTNINKIMHDLRDEWISQRFTERIYI
jgi:hypothetical protein